MSAAVQIELEPEVEQEGPEKAYLVCAYKYYLDNLPTLPRWKVVFFYRIYLPFVRFCYLKLGLPTVNRVDPQGNLHWEEKQAICSSEELAAEMIKGKPFWFYHELEVDVCGPEETCMMGKHVFSGVETEYENRQLDRCSIPRLHLKQINTLTSQAIQKCEALTRK